MSNWSDIESAYYLAAIVSSLFLIAFWFFYLRGQGEPHATNI
jgi:hypothetical protein